jgi:hypothetical protein
MEDAVDRYQSYGADADFIEWQGYSPCGELLAAHAALASSPAAGSPEDGPRQEEEGEENS